MKKRNIGKVPAERLRKLHEIPDFQRFIKKAKEYQDYRKKTPEDWKRDTEAFLHLINGEDYNRNDVINEACCEPESRSVVFLTNGEVIFE